MSSSTSSSGRGSSLSVTGHVGPLLGELGPCHAEQQDRRARARAARRARSGRGRSPRPTGCRRTRPRAAAPTRPASSVLRKAQAISSADVVASLSPSSERIAVAAVSSAGTTVELLQHLDDGPVRDPLAVGEAATADDRRVHRREQPPRRAVTCRRRRRRRPSPARSAARPARAATRPAGARARARVRRTACRAGAPARRAPVASRYAGTGSALPFSSSGSTASTSTASRTSASVGCPISTSPGVRRLLQAGGDVDRVAGREPLLRPRHHLARHHADPTLQPQLRERVAHLDRRPHRAQCVVLVHHRHAEDGHHGVADELLDGAAVALDDRLHPLEVAREQRRAAARDRASRRARSSRSGRRTGRSPSCAARAGGSRRRFGAALGAEPERSFRLEAATRHTSARGQSRTRPARRSRSRRRSCEEC